MSRPDLHGIIKAIAAGALMAGPWAAQAQTPLEGPATRLVNFETAATLPAGTWSLQAGSQQTDLNTGSGTGSQLYYGALDYAFSDRLQFGVTTQVIEDALVEPILGSTPPTRFLTVGGSVKYRFLDLPNLQAAVQVSAELLHFRTALFGTDASGADNVVGSLQLPITYAFSPKLRLHLTPAVAVFPDALNGLAYYGTVASLGAGVSFQPTERLRAFATLNAPLSGGNTITATRAITRELVYTAGLRFAFTPKVALEGYVTNAVGISPATGILTFYPDGDIPMFGLRVQYTPGARLRDSYRPTPLAAPTARALQLQQDGLTVGSAGVLEPGVFRFSASGGSQGNYAVAGSWGIDRDFQIDAAIEDYSDDGTLTPADDPTPGSARWMAGGRIRVLDQNNGDAVSLSMRVLGGRDLENLDVGVLYVAFPLSYDVNERLSVHAEPKFAAFGSTRIAALGLGANFELTEGLQLMGEATAVNDGRDPVWAAGARYDLPGTGLSVDLSATNAIGRYGQGTMIAQEEPRFSLGVSTRLGLFARR